MSSTPANPGSHAIVIGASIGGLFTAAVLADHFDRITVLDRDELPEGPLPRRAIPQGSHCHILMGAGLAFLAERFPGLVGELVAGGASVRDWDTLAWYHFGSWRPRIKCGIEVLHCSRYYLEWHVRRRVRALPNVVLQDQTKVTRLRHDSTKRRVVGVHVSHRGAEGELAADLVTDVSGTGSRAIDWMEAMGYARPPETRVGLDLAYTSRTFVAPPSFPRDPSFLVIHPRPPEEHRAGFLFAVENDRWMISLNGYFGDHAPTDEAGFLAFAKSLPQPHLHDRLKQLEPVSDIVRYTIPADVWHHFDRLREIPEGLVVLGDAAVRFNPIFGQGMTAAALSAKALGECLGAGGSREGLPRRFYRRHAATLAVPWLLTTSTDLRYAQATGHRPAWLGALNWYTGNLIETCGEDPATYGHFLRVLHMLDGLAPVLRPDVVAKVLLRAARGALPRAGAEQAPITCK